MSVPNKIALTFDTPDEEEPVITDEEADNCYVSAKPNTNKIATPNKTIINTGGGFQITDE